MDLSPVTLPLFLSQTLNLVITLAWLTLMGLALAHLRRLSLSEEAKALWAGLIVIIPFLGALAFWVVAPGRLTPQAPPKALPMLPAPAVATGPRRGVEVKGVEIGQAV
ncbi:MAG: hypothetical protein DYG89_41850 [Caldilinea sp. CFX5]|nr:hypothetical protein [Caldilinea sp. CFX5]